MNEIRVLNCLFDPRIAGPSVRVISVAKRLRPKGIETAVLVPDEDGPVEQAAIDAGVPVHRLRFRRPPRPTKPLDVLGFLFAFPGDVIRFRRLIKETSTDVVHVNGVMFPQPAVAARMAGARVVWHLNDTILPGPLAKIAGLFIRMIATHPVAAAGAVGDHYGVKKRTVLYAPVDASRFPPRPARDPAPDEIRIGMVGNWNWVKGQERFVRVIAKLKERLDKPVRGILVGRILDNQMDHHESVMAEAEALGVADNLEVLGFQANPAETIASFDIQLLPSHSEACPISVLEAMSVGVPVVAFAVGGVREEIERPEAVSGIVVPNGDCEAMAQACVDLLTDPARYRESAANGLKVIQDVFVIDRIADAHEALYRRAVEGKRD